MSDTTAISWCDRTWSPWEGCTKISPGCDNCYAAARNGRFSRGANWGPGAPRRKTKDWSKPYAWNREAQLAGKRISVFPSICDPFDNEIDPEWRVEFFALIAGTQHLDWLLLTKRIGNAAAMIDEAVAALRDVLPAPFWPWHNVWLGATVGCRPTTRRRGTCSAMPSRRLLRAMWLRRFGRQLDLRGAADGPRARARHSDRDQHFGASPSPAANQPDQ